MSEDLMTTFIRTMIFKYFDGNNKFILANRETRLLYSLQLPQDICTKLTKKANKNKRKTNVVVSTVYPNIKERVINMLTHEHGYYTTFDEYEEEFTISFDIKYANDGGIYSEETCTIELKGSLIENYLTLPIGILENLNAFELYAHSNRRNTILENEIKKLRDRIDNARVYTYSDYSGF